jgi:mycothiol system anti-sigma-R factor
MTCQEAVRHLYPFLDRALEARKSRAVRRHLDQCRACCTKFEFERALKLILRERAQEGEVPPSLRQRIAGLTEAF